MSRTLQDLGLSGRGSRAERSAGVARQDRPHRAELPRAHGGGRHATAAEPVVFTKAPGAVIGPHRWVRVPRNSEFRLQRGGQWEHDNTTEMVFGVADIVRYLSRFLL